LVEFIAEKKKVVSKDEKVRNGFMLPAFLYTGDISNITKKRCKNCSMQEFKKEGEEMICLYCGRRVKVIDEDKGEYKVISEGKNQQELLKDSPKYRKAYEKVKETSLLGVGDLVLPGFVIAAAAFSVSIWAGLLMAVLGLIGMLGNFVISKKLKIPLPALPLVCVAQLIGFYILMLIA
jgi:uncharacterized Zn finger protein (UPF0148 family)